MLDHARITTSGESYRSGNGIAKTLLLDVIIPSHGAVILPNPVYRKLALQFVFDKGRQYRQKTQRAKNSRVVRIAVDISALASDCCLDPLPEYTVADRLHVVQKHIAMHSIAVQTLTLSSGENSL